MKPTIKLVNIVLAVVTPLLIAGYGCGKSSDALSRDKDGQSRSANVSTSMEDAGNDLRNALTKLKTAYPYRLTFSTSTFENGKPASSESSVTEFAAADRLRIKTADKSGNSTEMIVIGDDNYLKFEGKWVKETMSPAEKAKMQEDRDKFSSSLSDVHFVGVETIGGVECKVYTYRWGLDISVSGKLPEGSGKAWIGGADGLPRQLDLNLEINLFRTMYHSVYEYNVKVKIEAPKV